MGNSNLGSQNRLMSAKLVNRIQTAHRSEFWIALEGAPGGRVVHIAEIDRTASGPRLRRELRFRPDALAILARTLGELSRKLQDERPQEGGGE